VFLHHLRSTDGRKHKRRFTNAWVWCRQVEQIASCWVADTDHWLQKLLLQSQHLNQFDPVMLKHPVHITNNVTYASEMMKFQTAFSVLLFRLISPKFFPGDAFFFSNTAPRTDWKHTLFSFNTVFNRWLSGFTDNVMHLSSYFICKRRTTNCFWCGRREWWWWWWWPLMKVTIRQLHFYLALKALSSCFYIIYDRWTVVSIIWGSLTRESGVDRWSRLRWRHVEMLIRFIGCRSCLSRCIWMFLVLWGWNTLDISHTFNIDHLIVNLLMVKTNTIDSLLWKSETFTIYHFVGLHVGTRYSQ